ncbi:MAG: MtrB/PioB family outer membrane beta-barrel protein [Candidatus Eisenbacteria bacterium]|nr:MtrB/PioB family outer membrane beta-barrel protein [Candidatus Eisenbacteria bacterium]
MRSKIFVCAMISGVIVFSSVSAQEKKSETEASVTWITPETDGQRGKFNEYRDIKDGVYVGVETRFDKEKYYLDFRAKDVGYKTQRHDLEGRKWGKLGFFLQYNELPHNLTYGATSFYTGVGGANLTYVSPTPANGSPNKDISTWTAFDYSTERKNYGGGLRLEMLKPFFLDASLNREERSGVYPVGVAGTSPGGPAIELPAPTSYVTDDLKLEAGYARNPFFVSLSYIHSNFKNNNSELVFVNPSTKNTAATSDTFMLPPSNDCDKLGLSGAVKLPFRSKLSFNATSSNTQSHVNLLTSYVADVTGGRTSVTSLRKYVFDGKTDTRSYRSTFTSSPFYFLDGKVFYKYYNRENKSDSIRTTVGTTTLVNHLFDYRKAGYGAELGFKLPASFYFTTSYTHGRIEREERDDIPTNTDDTYGTELRWGGSDFMVARMGYERLVRRGAFVGRTVTGATDAANIERYQRRFDAAPRDRNAYKAMLDVFPTENVNINLGYRYKDTKHKETILGVRSDKRNEFNVDGDYLIAKRVRLFAYVDYEHAKIDQQERRFDTGTNADPGGSSDSLSYTWQVAQIESNYGYGIGTDVHILPQKLALKLQHSSSKSDGSADYTIAFLRVGRTQDNIDISNWGRYRTRYYLGELTYNLTKTLSFGAGYIYTVFASDDAQYSGYKFLYPAGSTNGNFLTGAYADLTYKANIVYFSVAYRP